MFTVCIFSANAAENWKLLPIDGNQPRKWAEGKNWTHSKGNPYKAEGGEWLLAYQDKADPEPTEEYKPMKAGTYVNYYYVWQGDKDKTKDPRLSYRKTILKARPQKAGIHKSRSSVIIFTPDVAGKYKVVIDATAKVQNHTAGYAVVTFGVLSADGKNFTEKKTLKLNSTKPGAYGKHPSELKIDDSLELAEGERIVLRLQTYSPGNASAGSCALIISNFTVSTNE